MPSTPSWPVASVLLALIAFSLPSPQAQAQETAPQRTVNLQLFYWHESNSAFLITTDNIHEEREKRFLEPIELWYPTNGEFQRVQVRPGQRSRLITVPAGKDITFYRTNPTGLKNIPESEILRVPVDVAVSQGLILMRGNDRNLQANLIDVSDARIPEGAMRVVNYTSRQIVAKIGKEVVPVPLSESALVRLNNDSTSSLKLMIAELDPGKDWKIFYSTVISVASKKRMLVMVYPSAENHENLKVKILSIPG
jgi:hypothetical protein